MVMCSACGRFPKLNAQNHKTTSPRTTSYNCIAWAAGDTTRWWWPTPHDYYWPYGVSIARTPAAFVSAFESIGYTQCNDSVFEEGFDKIAIYVNSLGEVAHAARQLGPQTWTSKLGSSEDITHELDVLEGAAYGKPTAFLKRRKT